MYLIKCPRCKNEFKREIVGFPLTKSTTCPYCSKVFRIHTNINKTNIVKKI